MRPLRRELSVISGLTTAIAAAALCAGCSGGAKPAAASSPTASAPPALAPAAAVQAAARATQESSTARIEMSAVSELNGKTGTVRGTGAFDYRAKRGQFEMTIVGGAASALAAAGGEAGGSAGTTLTIKVVQDGGVTYLGGLPGMPKGQWIKDADDQGLSSSSASMDPTKSLQMLDQVAVGGVRRVGAGRVRDVPVTHYQAQVDLAKATATLGLLKGPLASVASTLSGRTMPVDVYVDDRQRIRELDETLDLPLPSDLGGGTSHTKSSLQMFDYDQPVQIAVPSGANVLGGPAATP